MSNSSLKRSTVWHQHIPGWLLNGSVGLFFQQHLKVFRFHPWTLTTLNSKRNTKVRNKKQDQFICTTVPFLKLVARWNTVWIGVYKFVSIQVFVKSTAYQMYRVNWCIQICLNSSFCEVNCLSNVPSLSFK